jgi:putative methionine-R-sulfoxide reductase with GAF domain
MEPTGPNLAGTSRQSRVRTERRYSMRHRTHSPAYARLDASQPGVPDLSEILDISEDGMSIQTSTPLPVERNLSLSMDLSETSTSIRTSGRVVWSDSSGRAGIHFAQLSVQSLHQLKEWLFVNVLTAFDHADDVMSDGEGSNSASKGLASSHTMRTDEFALGTPANSGDVAGARKPVAGTRAAGATRAKERAIQRESDVEPTGIDRETTLQSIAERALTLARASGAAIALSEGNDNEMVCAASAGSDAPPVGCRLQVGSGFSGECVRTGRSLRCDDSETDGRVDRDGCRALGIRSMIAVPIRFGNKVSGLVEVFSPQPYAFNADDIGALQQLTGSVVSVVSSSAADSNSQSAAQSSVRSPASRPSPAIPVAPPPPPVATAPPRTEKRAPAKAAVIEPARPIALPRPATRTSLPKALFVAAIGTFVFAVLWLIAPWLSAALHSSRRINSPVQPVAAAPAKSPNLPADVTDLASLRKVAAQGDPAAQFALGARYATGEEVNQDYTEAVRWFTMAADQGHILAQATLGAYYWAGRGVPQDLTKAYYWSVLAQAGGDQASKYRVAVLASRMSRAQVLAAQQQANDWLSNFASRPPSNP